jgi:hypothetical protein
MKEVPGHMRADYSDGKEISDLVNMLSKWKEAQYAAGFKPASVVAAFMWCVVSDYAQQSGPGGSLDVFINVATEYWKRVKRDISTEGKA